MTDLLISIPAVLICITIHEFAHGYIAYLLGDKTALNQGRLTLNPIAHIDPIGFFCLIFFRFGWAKPIPVSSYGLSNPKRDLALIALAGPLSNILLSLVCMIIMRILSMFLGVPLVGDVIAAFITFFNLTAIISTGLAVFNLLPIPPLDGYKIIYNFLPNSFKNRVNQYQQFISFGLIILLYLGILSIPLSLVSSLILDLLSNIAFIGL